MSTWKKYVHVSVPWAIDYPLSSAIMDTDKQNADVCCSICDIAIIIKLGFLKWSFLSAVECLHIKEASRDTKSAPQYHEPYYNTTTSQNTTSPESLTLISFFCVIRFLHSAHLLFIKTEETNRVRRKMDLTISIFSCPAPEHWIAL